MTALTRGTVALPRSYVSSPYVDAQGRTDAETYLMGCLDGTIVAGRRIKALAEKMLPRIRNGYKCWRFDVDAATRPVEFIERFCMIPSGKLGQPFIMEPFQRCITELIFGFVDEDENRQIQYALIEESRKNGKSSWVAAIELYLLLADGEGAPQIYNAATSKAQASLAYGAVWRMVRQSPELMKFLRKGTVVERAENGIICDGNLGYIIPLSKQTDHLDGLDVHGVALDELSAMSDRATFDLVKQGMGARSQPLMIAITTQGFVRDNVWDHERDYAVRWLEGKIEDDRFLGVLFELDDRSEIWDETKWAKANPGLGTIKSVEYLRAQVLKAKNDPSYMPTLLTKDFDLPANQASAYFTFEEAVNRTEYKFDSSEFRYAIVGIDAADTIDLNAATALFMRKGDSHIYRRSMYWIAEEQVKVNSNNQRGRDGVPYQEWAARGLLRIVPGNKVQKRVFVEWIQELADDGLYTRFVGYDPWHMDDSTLDLMRGLVGSNNVEVVRQGVQTLSQPLKQIRADMRDHKIVDGNNPIDHWCNLNLAVKVDANENVQPVKKAGATTRIDGFMALLDAYITMQRHLEEYMQIAGIEYE